MITLGITGSIGMGKSTVMRMLQDMHIPTQSADSIVHDILGPNGLAVSAVAALFPHALQGNQIDRHILGQALHDDNQIAQLERILHPLVFATLEQFKQDMQQACHPVIAIDIPLLYETNAQRHVDRVICVSAPLEIQRTRVMARPNMTAEKFAAILARQWPDHVKRAHADYVIDNHGSLDDTKQQLRLILDHITTGT